MLLGKGTYQDKAWFEPSITEMRSAGPREACRGRTTGRGHHRVILQSGRAKPELSSYPGEPEGEREVLAARPACPGLQPRSLGDALSPGSR